MRQLRWPTTATVYHYHQTASSAAENSTHSLHKDTDGTATMHTIALRTGQTIRTRMWSSGSSNDEEVKCQSTPPPTPSN
uniref:Uncharacterized protein n=1 Tax=Anopheles albimanus TaxID=7167 RepID=A0A182FYM2_ANOAL